MTRPGPRRFALARRAARAIGGDMTLFPPAACSRLIVKIGSALLVDPAGAVRRDWLAGIAADIGKRTKAGQQVPVVSSGAIALGARRLGLTTGGRRPDTRRVGKASVSTC